MENPPPEPLSPTDHGENTRIATPTLIPIDPISAQSIATTTATTTTSEAGSTSDMGGMTEAESLARSKSTKRLLARPTGEGLIIDTEPTTEDDERLHAIVGQHLAVTPAITGAPVLPSPVDPATPSSAFNNASPLNQVQSISMDDGGSNAAIPAANRQSLASFATSTTLANSSDPFSNGIGPLDDVPGQMKEEPATTASSHFNLMGADVSNDVYKWHEKEQRRQMLGDRSQTFHATPTTDDPDIANIKAPGGFRRHFVQTDAAARGEPAPILLTKSFIHFLGRFNMYEMDHFAGENFHSIPRRSIVVPKDVNMRRKSLSETLHSERKVYHPGQLVAEDEEVIEEPEEKISFGSAVGMLFKT